MTKTVLITGANRGIGLEFAKHYSAQDGFTVVATARAPEQAVELQALAEHKPVKIFKLDVSQQAEINALAQKLKNTPIDILLSNAGFYGPKKIQLLDIKNQDWQQVLAINTIAPLNLAQAFLPHVKNSQTKTMAFISSKMASISDNQSGGSYIYRSSKAALNAVVRSLAHDLSEYDIKTLALHPGWVKTEMGGPNALITTKESVAGLTQVIANVTSAQSGQFINFDGARIDW